jgi:predicted phage terminase large subunit-like protein
MYNCDEFKTLLTDSGRKLKPTADKRKTARETLLAFTEHTRPDYRTNWHHETLAEMLDRVAAGNCRRLMVFMPPQHGKSELVSRRFPAWMLGQDPNLRLIAASHTHELAVAMNRDVQRVMDHERYRDLYPEVRLATPRSPRGLFLPRRTMGFFEIANHRGSLRSAGVGQSIAGLPADGAIIDDPFGKREDADSSTIRQKIWDWYANDLYTRLSAEAWIVLTHTRWHRDDLAGRLLQKMADRAADQWEVLCLQAVKEDGEPSEMKARLGDAETRRGTDDEKNVVSSPPHRVSPSPCLPLSAEDTRLPGEPLWPAFKSAADLEVIRQQDARAFAALYQQDPAQATLCEWPPELFGEFIWTSPQHWPREFKYRVVCLDASKGSRDRPGDYSAIVFVGVGTDRLLYVDALIDRIPLDQIVRRTIAFCDQYRPDHVGIEAEQFQELLVHEFQRQRAERPELRLPVWKMKTAGVPKVARIRRLTQYITRRELRFRQDSPGCRRLVDQLMDFPLAEHDDGPDALEMCTRLLVELKRLR